MKRGEERREKRDEEKNEKREERREKSREERRRREEKSSLTEEFLQQYYKRVKKMDLNQTKYTKFTT